MANTLEERVLELEKQASFYRGALLVAGICALGFLGITGFVQIPSQVRTEVNRQVGEEVQNRVATLKTEFDNLSKSKDMAANTLGIPAIKETATKLDGRIAVLERDTVRTGDTISIENHSRPRTWALSLALTDNDRGGDARIGFPDPSNKDVNWKIFRR